MATTIQLKRGRASTWTSQNPVLAMGEVGLVVDNSGTVIDRKTGNGQTHWNSLSRDRVYWDQIYDPGSVIISESQVTGLVSHLAGKASVSDLALKAPLYSPDLTGSPTAVTTATNDNSTKIATTQFVNAFVTASRIKPDWNALSTDANGILNKPLLTGLAPISSPVFTGDPSRSSSISTSDNSLKLATTAFVKSNIVKPNWTAASGTAAEILNKPLNATTVADGFMSRADKALLDSIPVSINTLTGSVDNLGGSFTTLTGRVDDVDSSISSINGVLNSIPITYAALAGSTFTGQVTITGIEKALIIETSGNDNLSSAFLSPALASGSTTGVCVGRNITSNNSVVLGFFYGGSGNPLNVGYLSMRGNGILGVYDNGGVSIGSGYALFNVPPTNGLTVQGSVCIGKTSATTALDVQGTVTATNFSGNGSGLTIDGGVP